MRKHALRELVRVGLDAAGDDRAEARARAIETLGSLESWEAASEALEILGGKRPDGGRLASDREACLALLSALARHSQGQVELVRLAVKREDLLADRAADALPRSLAPEAESALLAALGSDRDRVVRRAAMIASAHASAGLIPGLIHAQTAERRAPVGDEGWIAFGRTRWYIANAVPVVGNGSTSFLPVPGSVFEGSVLRIRESVVVVYRTEVHRVLVSAVEELTGQPAPPFGFDREQWRRWYDREFARLASDQRLRLQERAIRSELRTTEPRNDQ